MTFKTPRLAAVLGAVLIAACGDLDITNTNAPTAETLTNAPLQEHSVKPAEQYAIIERLSPGPYLELFARRRRPGWDAWGHEVASDVDL